MSRCGSDEFVDEGMLDEAESLLGGVKARRAAGLAMRDGMRGVGRSAAGRKECRNQGGRKGRAEDDGNEV